MASTVAYGSLPFKEQIAFFRAKKNVLTEAWTDVWAAEHDHAFMVAGANRIDLLIDLRAAVDKAIADGTGLEVFRRDFDKIVAKYGWAYNGGRNWRTRVIYETNLRSSYAAGRYAQLQALKSVRPFWIYRHSDAVMHPRPMHLAWNGMVLSADDPWWNTHYPPNGWGCQCTVEGLNARDLKRLGKTGPDKAPPLDLQDVTVGVRGPSPRTVQTPAGVDPGFGYAPGRNAFDNGPIPLPKVPVPRNPLMPVPTPREPSLPVPIRRNSLVHGPQPLPGRSQPGSFVRLTQDTVRKTTQLPALSGAELLGELLQRDRVGEALAESFNALQLLAIGAGLLTASNAPQDETMVGALNPSVVRALKNADITPGSAPIVSTATAARSTLRPGITDVLLRPSAVLFDRSNRQLVYVGAGGDGQVHIAQVLLATADGAANTYVGDDWVAIAGLQQEVDAGELQLLTGEL